MRQSRKDALESDGRPCDMMQRYQAWLANRSSGAAANSNAASAGNAFKCSNGSMLTERVVYTANPLVQSEIAILPPGGIGDKVPEVQTWRAPKPGRRGGSRYPSPAEGDHRAPLVPGLCDHVDRF